MGRFITSAAFTVMLIGMSTAAVAASESLAGRLSLTVHVRNHAGVPTGTLRLAEDEMTEIYRAIGITTRWINLVADSDGIFVTPENERTIDRTTVHVQVSLLSPEMEKSASHARPIADGVLGLAHSIADPSDATAYILCSRVLDAALGRNVNTGAVLGYVMAHEVGHLLLPTGGHSSKGIMRAGWEGHRIAAFTSEQGEVIRGRVVRLAAASQEW